MSNQVTRPEQQSGGQVSRKPTNDYAFGPLTFSVQGNGVFCMSDRLRERIAAMPLDELRAVNREAWRQKRPLVRASNRECNVSRYGWNDRRDQAIEVCEQVCKVTWRVIAGAQP